MRKLVLTCLISGLFIGSGYAQTLFTYGNNPVSKEDFLRVYEKNSLNKKVDLSEPALRDYLELYSLFRMKVKEAELQHLDTLESIQRELDNYRKQLARNYLTDEQVTVKLEHEAYDRMKEDIHVQHILILCPISADSTVAYKKIDSIYHAIVNKKADFSEMAKQYSEDRGSKDAGGDLGYVTALKTVYPFENAVYTTPVGKVSAPFRSQFGYHIVKVLEKRPAMGDIQVAQILIATPKSKGEEGVKVAEKRADSIEVALKQGASFEEMVKKYSEDKFTVNDDGRMKIFGVGQTVPAFESAAFALKKPGDISKPVRTEYGFHIIKLIDKYPLKPFDSVQSQIKHKIDNDSRAQMARDLYMQRVKEKNNFKEYPANLAPVTARFRQLPDTGKMANTFKAEDFKDMTAPLFTLAGKDYRQIDFVNYAAGVTHGRLMGAKANVVNDLYKMYLTTVLNDFQEHKLVDENVEFRNLMEEYKDGIMLFELMDRNVWGKASKDTVGLTAFYESHKDKYMWEPGFKGAVYKFKNEAAMKEGMKVLNKKKSTDEDVTKAVNSNKMQDGVSIVRGRFEFSRFKEVSKNELIAGKTTKAVKNEDGSYTVVKVDEVYNTPTSKSLDEARGYVVAEYQDYLEKKWNEQMRAKYPVKVNEDVFKSMVR